MLLWFEKYIFLFRFIQKRVVGDLSMTQHTVSLVFRKSESPESREEKYWMTR